MPRDWGDTAANMPSFSSRLGNSFINRLEQQHATWINGPSLPNHMPEATERHCVCVSEESEENEGPSV